VGTVIRRGARTLPAVVLATVIAATGTSGCSSSAPADRTGLVWPPTGIDSPGEIVWMGSFDRLRPRGGGKFFRAIAGASSDDVRWKLARPTSVAVRADRVGVVDTGGASAFAADIDGARAVRFQLPSGTVPVAIAATHDGDGWLVVDGPTASMLFFSDRGELQRSVEPQVEILRCAGAVATAGGDVVLTDAQAGLVVRLAPDGSVRAVAGGPGVESGRFNRPTAVAEGPDDSVWVLDALNFRVQRLTPDLEPLSMFGTHGDGSGHLALPKGLAVDPDGNVYISDAQFDLIQVFDDQGDLLLSFGARGDGPGQFWTPAGLAFDDRGHLAVADAGNGRVQVLRYRERGGTP